MKYNAWHAECRASIFRSCATPKFINQAIEKMMQMHPDCREPNIEQMNNRERYNHIELDFGYIYDANYDELIEKTGVVISHDAKYIWRDEKFRIGYVYAEIRVQADVPDSIRQLLRETGNLTTNVLTHDSVNCTI